jgi:EpsI family protein
MTSGARVSVAAVLLVGALVVLQLRSTGEAVPIRKPLDTFPAVLGVWQEQQSASLASEELNVLKVNDYVMRRYVDGQRRYLWLYIGYWATQRKGAQIHSPQNCLPGGGWEPVEASRLTIDLPAPYQPIVVNRYLIQKDRDLQVVLYWYQARGKVLASEFRAKIEMVQSAIVSNRTDGALVRVSTPTYGNAQDATERLVQYVQSLYPVLGEYLPD